MITKRKALIIYIITVILAGIVCAALGYSLTMESQKSDVSKLYGTYLFDSRNITSAEYLAVIPPSGKNGTIAFQWYDLNHRMLHEGSCKKKKAFLTFYENQKAIATLTVINKTFYFTDKHLKPIAITKISEEAQVARP